MTRDGSTQAHLHIGHESLDQSTGGVYQHLHPVTQEPQALIPLAGKAEMDLAVNKAHAAFPAWRAMAPTVRRDILLRLADLISENVDAFARLAALDGGTPLSFGKPMAQTAAEFHRYYAGWADKIDGQILASYQGRGHMAYTVPEPYGVVGIITTWNGPLFSLGMKAAPALAAGNCVVVKPSEMTPFASAYYATLAKEAGVPDGVLSVLAGAPEAGEALVRHPLVEKISFTGGPSAARNILIACADQLKPAVLELGGKSASIVFPDVDLDLVCQQAVWGTIGILAGQGCALPTRLVVHDSIHDKVVARLIEIASSFVIGDPMEPSVTLGPLINAAACDRVMGMLDRVRSQGTGKIVLGGNRCGGKLAGKNYIEPTIITDVDPQSEIAQIEIFGPVIVVQRFSTEDEAVEIANATRYGLAAYIQSKDVNKVHRIAERLKSGGVYVNGAMAVMPHIPFGGLGVSGYGKEGGRAGLDEFLRYKTVVVA